MSLEATAAAGSSKRRAQTRLVRFGPLRVITPAVPPLLTLAGTASIGPQVLMVPLTVTACFSYHPASEHYTTEANS